MNDDQSVLNSTTMFSRRPTESNITTHSPLSMRTVKIQTD